MKHLFFFGAILLCQSALAQNVGISTSSPSAKLHVNGTFKLTNGSQGLNKVLTSDAAGLATWKTLEKSVFKATGFQTAFNVAPNTKRILKDWKTVELDLGANSILSNAQGDFFVIREGLYRATVKVSGYLEDPGDSHHITLSILVNGTNKSSVLYPIPTNDNTFGTNNQELSFMVTSVFKLNAFDKFSFEFFNSGISSNTSVQFTTIKIANEFAEFVVEEL